MLRARWRELETELRTRLNGHEGGNPGYSQASVLTGHRASSQPYIRLPPSISDWQVAIEGFGGFFAGPHRVVGHSKPASLHFHCLKVGIDCPKTAQFMSADIRGSVGVYCGRAKAKMEILVRYGILDTV